MMPGRNSARSRSSAPVTDSDLLSIKRAAQRMGLSPSSVWRLVNEGAIPCYELGERVLLAVGDIQAYLDAHKVRRQGTPQRRSVATAEAGG